MTLRCKPGDLAYLVRVWNDALAENVGRIVRVISLSDVAIEGTGPLWNVETSEPGLLCGDDCGPGLVRRTHGVVRDSSLRPITPPGLTEEVAEEIEVTA